MPSIACGQMPLPFGDGVPDEERWLPDPGGYPYDVSSHGRVRRIGGRCDGAIIKPTKPKGSHSLIMQLYDGHGRRRLVSLAGLVLTAFVGPRPPGHEACHFPDADPDNCRLDNLRWGTRSENNVDRLKHGSNPTGYLTEADIPVIWRRLLAGESTLKIAPDYGVSWKAIYNIKIGRTWKHLTASYGAAIGQPRPRRPGRRSSGAAKLDEAKVCEIRSLLQQGRSRGDIARQFGVSAVTVGLIRDRKTWKSC